MLRTSRFARDILPDQPPPMHPMAHLAADETADIDQCAAKLK